VVAKDAAIVSGGCTPRESVERGANGLVLTDRLACGASDRTTWYSARVPRSRPPASDRFDATPQHALARIAPRASSPYPAPSQERQACMGSLRNYRWVGWALTVLLRRRSSDEGRSGPLRRYRDRSG
jgi:hypothetical protein